MNHKHKDSEYFAITFLFLPFVQDRFNGIWDHSDTIQNYSSYFKTKPKFVHTSDRPIYQKAEIHRLSLIEFKDITECTTGRLITHRALRLA